MKKVTITRKIQLIIEDDNIKEVYKTLYDWEEKVFRAANVASTHMYFQEKQSEFFYLTDEVKLLLSNAKLPVNSINSEKLKEEIKEGRAIRALRTSRQNTTYQVLSKKLKGDLPADIFSNLNAILYKNFSAEKKEYFSGRRSLRSYKRGLPIPFSAKNIRSIQITPDQKNYSFTLFNLNFRTNFGRDLSGNKIIFDRALDGEYKLCNSALQLKKGKIFLLAVFQFEKINIDLRQERKVFARLNVDTPIELNFGKGWNTRIGTKEEFLHRRMVIQAAMKRMQINMKYSKGGHGRKAKLKGLERFKEKEKNYVNSKLHLYSRMVIDACIKDKCGTLVLTDQSEDMKNLEGKIKEINENKELTKKDKRDLINKYKFVIQCRLVKL